MKNKWTTVADSTPSATPKQEDVSQKTTSQNKKVALAMAGIGVFFILVGAAPFLFGGGDSEDYSAFLARNLPNNTESDFQPEAQTITFEDGDEFKSDPVVVEIETDTKETVPEQTEGMGSIPLPPLPILSNDPTTSTEPTVVEVIPTIVKEPTLTETVADFTQETFSDPTIIQEPTTLPTETYPKNIHVGGIANPVVLPQRPTDPMMMEEEVHGAAMPKQDDSSQHTNPSTGLPLLPVFAFSGAAALYMSRRKK